jgi:hypothetical protein
MVGRPASLNEEVQAYLTSASEEKEEGNVQLSLSPYAEEWIRAHQHQLSQYEMECGYDQPRVDVLLRDDAVRAELARFIVWLERHMDLIVNDVMESNSSHDSTVVIPLLDQEGEETARYLWEGSSEHLKGAGDEVSDLWDFVAADVRASNFFDLWGVEHLYSIYRQLRKIKPISWPVWTEMRSMAPSVAAHVLKQRKMMVREERARRMAQASPRKQSLPARRKRRKGDDGEAKQVR